ncbi:MAG: TonB-dependent receptor [Verrucomicrobia bacterium]|nr:TonB-dependent receptor [Verrucomicrobiota bacterium]
MQPTLPLNCSFPISIFARRMMRPLVLSAALACALLAPPARAAEVGSITGSVSNTATGNLLEGAKIEVPQLGLTALTDNTGRFVLTSVPAGAHELVVSYIGLDTVRSPVTVAAGQRAVRDFDLTTAIYKLDAFKVTGEREGGAAAITAQRNAENVKNVVSTDSFGYLPNMSAGEVLMRLPGVAGSPTEEGLAYAFNIRGMAPALNTVTVDGSRLTTLGTSRAFETQSITGAMFDQMELVKGHTPDKGADSLGGTVNLKTRSALNMKEKRRFTYSFTARIAPSFTEQIPMREEHRAHPVLNFGYQEVFSVFGEQRNLGLSVNAFYSENAVGFFRTDRDFQNTTTQPAFVWSYRTQDNYNNRKQASVNVKTDYRLAASTKVSVNVIANDNYELSRIRWYVTANTGSQNQNTVPNATTSSIVPGFTDRITEVRAVPTSTINMQTVGPNHYMVRMRRLDLNMEQEFGPLQLDYTANYARTNLNNGQGEGGDFTMRLTGVGWILDRTQSDLHPRFTQTAGPDMTDSTNYRPAPNGLVHNNGQNENRLREVRGNARYVVPTPIPIVVKAGAQWRETLAQVITDGRRWNYVGTGPLPANPNRIVTDLLKTGRRIPQWETTWFYSRRKPVDPTLWSEDLYNREANKYSTPRTLMETVTAGYLMAQGKFGREGFLGRTSYLGGVRTEKTDTSGAGWVLARANLRATAARRLADPVGAAAQDYANTFRKSEGSYTKSFPSAHLTHDVTPNVKARLSWSTSFGRPAMTNFHPGESANETAQTLSINNPSLLPQMATNWDASLDYYFEPVGNLSVGFFKKTITDYIVSGINTGTIPSGNDNGYDGNYADFTRLQSLNAGTAFVQGWEFGYQQQFTFLPGLLKGLSGSVNYTIIETHGNFGSTTNSSTGQVAGFIPRAANVMLSWRYRSFSTRVLYNRTSDYVVSYSATTVGRNSFRQALEVVNLGLAYQLRPAVSLTCDISNLFNAPQVLYMGVPSQMQTTIINGVTINVGVSGRF